MDSSKSVTLRSNQTPRNTDNYGKFTMSQNETFETCTLANSNHSKSTPPINELPSQAKGVASQIVRSADSYASYARLQDKTSQVRIPDRGNQHLMKNTTPRTPLQNEQASVFRPKMTDQSSQYGKFVKDATNDASLQLRNMGTSMEVLNVDEGPQQNNSIKDQ